MEMYALKIALINFFSILGWKVWPDAAPFFKERKGFGIMLFIICFLSIVLIGISGCSSVGPVADTSKPEYFYRPDMFINFGDLDVNGKVKWYEGMAVNKLSGPLLIHFQSNVAMDRVEITTCSRHWVEKSVNPGWFGGAGKVLDYSYLPDQNEMNGLCPLHITAFSKDLLISWGMVFFRKDQSLPAHTDCNGVGTTFAGISACSTKAGIEEQITFAVPVLFEQTGPCQVKKIDNLNYLIRASSPGFCEMTFSDGKNLHDLILHGYDTVL